MTRSALSICLLLSLVWSQDIQAQTNIFLENFQKGYPDDWTQQVTDSTSDGFRWGTALTLSSTDFIIPDHGSFIVNNEDACRFGGTPTCNKADEWIILPAQDFRGLNGIRLSANVYFPGGTYSGATESASVQVSLDNINWTPIYTLQGDPSDWQTIAVDLTGYVNDSTVYLAFTYQDGGGWPYGLAIDDVVVRETPALDLATGAAPFGDPFIMAGPKPIRANLLNLGHDTVHSLRLHYQINEEDPVEQLFSGLEIPPLGTISLEADQVWEASASATLQTVDVWISEPNGLPDETSSNDHDIIEVGVLDPAQTIPRNLLLEHFTSTNSDSCALLNPTYQAALNDATVPVFGLSYHTWWPTPTDPFYTADPKSPDRRVSYYRTDAVPTVYVAGAEKGIRHALAPDSLALHASLPSPIRLEGEWVREYDGAYTAHVTVTTLASHWMQNLRVYTAVTDAFVPGPNPDLPEYQNDESDFHDVVLAMLPQPNGVAYDDSTAETSKTYEWRWEPDPAFEGADDIELTVFVQDNRSNIVLQAIRLNTRVSGLPAAATQANAKLYPNPASQWANLEWDLPTAEDLSIQVYDAMGRIQATLASGRHAAGQHQLNIDLTAYPSGTYWISLRGEQTTSTLPLQVMP